MRVTETLSFNEYWTDQRYRDKRPVRNGSSKMLVGDNIYHTAVASGEWLQADSHHSNPDGSVNAHNLAHDTSVDRVLLSNHYYYFGSSAPAVPLRILREMEYVNGRSYRVYALDAAAALLLWLETQHRSALNRVAADPFDFAAGALRYSAFDDRIR